MLVPVSGETSPLPTDAGMADASVNAVPSLPLRACMGLRIIREGLPMSREPALLTSAGRMPERSQHRVSEGRMPKANVRRRGMGSPEPSRLSSSHGFRSGHGHDGPTGRSRSRV